MQARSAFHSAIPVLLVGTLLGCGSSSGTGPGAMNVHLVDGPSTLFSKVTIEVTQLEIHGPADQWTTLATFPGGKVIDNLLGLTNGIDELLVSGFGLPAGHYDQMRLLLGAGNSVTLADGSVQPLKVPSGMQSGLKFPVSFDVAPGTTRDVFIDLDANRSVFVHRAGRSGQYILRPVIHAVDRLVTGSVTGRLTAADGTTGLGGVDVMAETVDASGHPSIFSHATTAADGTYTIALLPQGVPYHVVAQPVLPQATPPDLVYGAAASGPIVLTEAAPIATWSQSFTLATAVGALGGAITPVTTDASGDEVLVEQTFPAPPLASPTTLVVRYLEPTVDDSVTPASESYAATDLPAGGYDVVLLRTTTDASGVATVTSTDAGAVSVVGGVTATVDIAVP